MVEEEELENALNHLNYEQSHILISKDIIEGDYGVKLELIGSTWRIVTSPKKSDARGSRSVSIGGNCSQSVIITGWVDWKHYKCTGCGKKKFERVECKIDEPVLMERESS